MNLLMTLSKAQKHLGQPGSKAIVESYDEGGTSTTLKGSIDKMLRGGYLGQTSLQNAIDSKRLTP